MRTQTFNQPRLEVSIYFLKLQPRLRSLPAYAVSYRLLSRRDIVLRIFIFIIVAVALSFWVGGMDSLSALRDADTCWLLALGRMISEAGLPSTDPFSFTYPLLTQMGKANPFVMHQWLSELILYRVFNAGGLLGLVLLVSIITTLTFTVVPALYLKRTNLCPEQSLAVLIGCLAQLACAFHFFARPEIFSYLLFAIALRQITQIIRDKKAGILSILLYAALTTLWCNIHSSFVLAVALSFLPLIYAAAHRPLAAEASLPMVRWAWLPAASLLASLLNPAGVGLWTYLPKLFFMHVTIKENRTFGLSDLGQIELYPLFVLCVIYTICLIGASARQKEGRLLHILLAILAATLVFSRVRLIVYGLIIVAFELPVLLSFLVNLPTGKRAFLAVVFAPLACAGGSLYVSSALQRPLLPQPMAGFAPPFKAIQYLQGHRPDGPVFNDARFGDLMIWYISPPLPVFIDTRFDMYGDEFFAQYASINNCGTGWREALSDLAIEWIFLPPDRALVAALMADADWEVAYKDETAVILRKKHPRLH